MEHDQDQCKPFSAFDEKIIPESLRFFKCCLSVFPVSMRPVMAILIKFLELKLTIDYFHSHPRTDPLFQDKDVSLDSILSSLNPDLKEEMDLLQSMMQMMQMSQADGTSGSGKYTLLNILAGLERPTKGVVIISGHHIEKLNEEQLVTFRREHVGFIFQSFHLLGTMDALENVALPLSFRGESKEKRLKKAEKMLR